MSGFSFSDERVADNFIKLGIYEALQGNLAKPPSFTTLRCHTLKARPEMILRDVDAEIKKRHPDMQFDVRLHPYMQDLIIVSGQCRGPIARTKVDKEVIVDRFCGMAVLRGSDVFASGLLAMSASICEGDMVSLYVDIDTECLRGSLPPYDFNKKHIGNGIARYSRSNVYSGSSSLSGVGIEVTEPLYMSPKLDDLLPQFVFPQNLPSCLCAHVLDPQPGDVVLDMCAAPGGKTSHIGSLMVNSGTLIALDKAKKKIKVCEENLNLAGCTFAQVYCCDSSKAVQEEASERTLLPTAPPYPPGTFDRILLDAPCSALGQRPSLSNHMTSEELASYPALQRKLLSAAVKLLKENGVLVYSTCTFTSAENEEQISWLLKEYPEMSLEPQGRYHLRSVSIPRTLFPNSILKDEQLALLQSFHPAFLAAEHEVSTCDTDTIGFFIAKLRKGLSNA